MTKKMKTCREKHKIIRMRKVTIPGKRKGEKKYKKKKKKEDNTTAAIYTHQERKPQSR